MRKCTMECFQIDWKVVWWPGMFPGVLESFQIAWKVFKWSGKFLDDLECFQMAWKVSYGLVSFKMAWKVLKLPWKLPDCLDSFSSIWQVFTLPGLHSICVSSKFQKITSCFTKTFHVYKKIQVALLPCYPGFSAFEPGFQQPPLKNTDTRNAS